MGVSDFPDLVAPWQRVPLVHDDTDLFPTETMDALDARYTAAGGAVPVGGATGEVLTKDSGTDYDASWQAPTVPTELVPDGGSTGQVLTKDSGTDQDVSWQTPSAGGAGLGPVVLYHSFPVATGATIASTAETGQSTNVLAGTWVQNSNRAHSTSTTPTWLGIVWDAGIADGRFSYTFYLTNFSLVQREAFFIFRCVDLNNFMAVDWFRSGGGVVRVTLYKRVGGTFTDLVGPIILPNIAEQHDYPIDVVCDGTDIEVFIQGFLVMRYSGTTGLESATQAGFGGQADSNFQHIKFGHLVARS